MAELLYASGAEAGTAAPYTSCGHTFSGATVSSAWSHLSSDGEGGTYSFKLGIVTQYFQTKTFGTGTNARWLFFAFTCTAGFRVSFYRSGAVNAAVELDNTTNKIEILRGSSTVVATSAGTLSLGEHVMAVEMVADNTGTCNVYIDNDSVAYVSASGVDLQSTATSGWDQLRFSALGGGGTVVYIDDIVVGTSTYGRPNESYIPAVVGTSNGSTTQLTASAGDNVDCVNEIPPTFTTYVEGTTTGLEDTYVPATLPFTGTVRGVIVNAYMQRDGAITNGRTVLVEGGTTTYGTSTALGSIATPLLIQTIYDTNPRTAAAFTVDEINASEFGAEII